MEAGRGTGRYPSMSNAAPQMQAFTGSSRTSCGVNSCLERSRLMTSSTALPPTQQHLNFLLPAHPPPPDFVSHVSEARFSWGLLAQLRRWDARCDVGHAGAARPTAQRAGHPSQLNSPAQQVPLQAGGLLAAGLGSTVR